MLVCVRLRSVGVRWKRDYLEDDCCSGVPEMARQHQRYEVD